MEDLSRHVVDVENLPVGFPTHRHPPEFWQALGRAVATFGFLEEALGKAIFSFTATRSYSEEEIDSAYENWLPTLKRALSDPLGNLIASYGTAVRDHKGATIENLPELLANLRAASVVRNVICHGSWGVPDEDARSIPLFVNRQLERFETPIDVAYLDQLQRHTAELACAVIIPLRTWGGNFPAPVVLASRSYAGGEDTIIASTIACISTLRGTGTPTDTYPGLRARRWP